MSLETRRLYRFGPFQLDCAEGLLLRDGRPVPVTPKAFEILTVLVQNRGRLVTKDDLMKAVWPDTFVEEANLTVNMSALRRALGESGEGRQYIETVPRRGYRFNAGVKELAGETGRLGRQAGSFNAVDEGIASAPGITGIPQPLAGETHGSQTRRKQTAVAVLALMCAALVTLSYSLYRRQSARRLSFQGPRSLAILPFQNLRQDPTSDYLGYSLADALITKLANVSALTVRPSSAIQRYRNQVIDIRRVASDLNVDTILTGNFIRDGDDLRITSQLVDVKTEKILWRSTFDLKYEKLLTLQDQVAQQIIKGLEVSLSPSEVERLKPDAPIDPLGYEYYLRGVDLYSRSDFPMAIKMLEKSAEIDPNYALTWAQLGRSYTADASFQFGGREQYRKAQAAYEKSLSLQPARIETEVYMANFLTDTGEVERAVPLLRQALKANPNHAEAHWELGYAYRFGGMLAESILECERARQLDPGVKLTSSALNSYFYLGQYDKFLQSLPTDSNSGFILFYRGFGEYYKGNREQAAQDFDRAFDLDPSLYTQIGAALSNDVRGRRSKGLGILHAAERRAEERGVGDPEATYKIAEAYAILGDRISALHALRHSIENGFFSYPYFMTDPLLNSLHEDAGFAALMEVARRRHQAFKTAFFLKSQSPISLPGSD